MKAIWAAAVLVVATACIASPQGGPEGAEAVASGTLRLALAGPKTNQTTIAVRNVFDPSDVYLVDCTQKDHQLNGQDFCDELLVLPPGVYDVIVQTLDSRCHSDQDHYKVVVKADETSELPISMLCESVPGGLDIVITQKSIPGVASVSFQFTDSLTTANKYLCQCGESVRVTATALDDDNTCEQLTGTWKATDGAGVDVTATLLSGAARASVNGECRFSVVVSAEVPVADFQLAFEVKDPDGHAGAFALPLHVIDCGNTCPASCASTLAACNDACVDTRTDPQNCGACGAVCAGGRQCTNGVCVCPAGTTVCGGVCVNTKTDPYNCNGCGMTCPAGAVCVNGSCLASCPTGQTKCGLVCVDTKTDAKNCGGCGVACAGDQACKTGVCTDLCQTPGSGLSIASSFNTTPISAGRYLWFNAAFDPGALSGAAKHVYFRNVKAYFGAGGTSYIVSLPDAVVTFDPAATSATTSLSGGLWRTTVPLAVTGNVFLSGLAWPVPAALPGGITPVTMTGMVTADSALGIAWQWSAAVYTQVPDAAAPAVKAAAAGGLSPYTGTEPAGTPMGDKLYVVGGARGSGGTSWTGTYTAAATVSVSACVP